MFLFNFIVEFSSGGLGHRAVVVESNLVHSPSGPPRCKLELAARMQGDMFSPSIAAKFAIVPMLTAFELDRVNPVSRVD